MDTIWRLCSFVAFLVGAVLIFMDGASWFVYLGLFIIFVGVLCLIKSRNLVEKICPKCGGKMRFERKTKTPTGNFRIRIFDRADRFRVEDIEVTRFYECPACGHKHERTKIQEKSYPC